MRLEAGISLTRARDEQHKAKQTKNKQTEMWDVTANFCASLRFHSLCSKIRIYAFLFVCLFVFWWSRKTTIIIACCNSIDLGALERSTNMSRPPKTFVTFCTLSGLDYRNPFSLALHTLSFNLLKQSKTLQLGYFSGPLKGKHAHLSFRNFSGFRPSCISIVQRAVCVLK